EEAARTQPERQALRRALTAVEGAFLEIAGRGDGPRGVAFVIEPEVLEMVAARRDDDAGVDLEGIGEALERAFGVEGKHVIRPGTEGEEGRAPIDGLPAAVEAGVELSPPLEERVSDVGDLRPRHEGEAARVAPDAAAEEEAHVGLEALADLEGIEAPAPE